MAFKYINTTVKKCNVIKNTIRNVCKHINVNGVNVWNSEMNIFPVSDTDKTYRSFGGSGSVTVEDSRITVSLSTNEVKYNYSTESVNLSGYTTAYFTLEDVSASEGFWCNIGFATTKATAPQAYIGVSKGDSVYAVDISDAEGEQFIVWRGKRGKYDGSAFKITRIWLE